MYLMPPPLVISKRFKQQTWVWFLYLDIELFLSFCDDVTEFLVWFLLVAIIFQNHVSKMVILVKFQVNMINHCSYAKITKIQFIFSVLGVHDSIDSSKLLKMLHLGKFASCWRKHIYFINVVFNTYDSLEVISTYEKKILWMDLLSFYLFANWFCWMVLKNVTLKKVKKLLLFCV